LRGQGRTLLLSLVLTASTALVACTSAKTGTTTNVNGAGVAPRCGAGTGQKATGAPIRLGAIATKQPGTDFTDIPNMAKAVFDCVNDNGGIKGRPIEYIIETEQTDPSQIAALARKLIETDKVLAIVGNTSIIECAINHGYYEQQGFFIVDSGIAPECYSTPNSAPVNMGARYSVIGATQYLVRQGVKKLVLDQSNVPITGYVEGGFLLTAQAAGIPTVSLKDNVPIQDANSVALRAVQAAGQDGGVVLNFTPPEALKILQAAEQMGLQDRVKWACSTPCNTDFLASALGPQWNGKLGVNAELNLTSAPGPDSELYRAVQKRYAPNVPLGSFSQMGFVQANIVVRALLSVTGALTAKSVNEAIRNIRDFKTDILCKPWYYGTAPLHIPNNTDRTVVPQNGRMVEKEGCFPISEVDPAIKLVREIEADG